MSIPSLPILDPDDVNICDWVTDDDVTVAAAANDEAVFCIHRFFLSTNSGCCGFCSDETTVLSILSAGFREGECVVVDVGTSGFRG